MWVTPGGASCPSQTSSAAPGLRGAAGCRPRSLIAGAGGTQHLRHSQPAAPRSPGHRPRPLSSLSYCLQSADGPSLCPNCKCPEILSETQPSRLLPSFKFFCDICTAVNRTKQSLLLRQKREEKRGACAQGPRGDQACGVQGRVPAGDHPAQQPRRGPAAPFLRRETGSEGGWPRAGAGEPGKAQSCRACVRQEHTIRIQICRIQSAMRPPSWSRDAPAHRLSPRSSPERSLALRSRCKGGSPQPCGLRPAAPETGRRSPCPWAAAASDPFGVREPPRPTNSCV